jgi:DNA-binding NarL/FixJ family response regulator
MALRFLIVDDHPLMRGAVRNTLETFAESVATEQAGTLRDAMQRLAAGVRFDLVLLDLNLPDAAATGGLQALRDRFPATAVLVLSAQSDRATVERCLRAGARGFLPKNASAERLAGAVRTIIQGGTYAPPEADPPHAREPQAIRWPGARPTVMAAPHPGSAAAAADPRQLGLTDRQSDVLRLILRGLPNKLIGRQLHLAEGTVKVHVSAVLRALGARNRTQAVLAASRLGLRLPD